MARPAPAVDRTVAVRNRLATQPGARLTLSELARELFGAETFRSNHVGAPVVGTDGRVAIALFHIGLRGQIRGDAVPAFAERLLAAATEITAARGRSPGPRAAAG